MCSQKEENSQKASADSTVMLVALQKYQVCQHLITHSCSMWPHKETAMTEDTFHGC